jgi:hypothetical protein
LSADGGLADACAELAGQLGQFDAFEVRNGRGAAGLHTTDYMLADLDRTPVTRTAKSTPASRPPGNAAALWAATDAHQLIRRVEASLRLLVTGHTGPARGGSDGNTLAALDAIAKMGTAVPFDAARQAARLLRRAALEIERLSSVDTAPRWSPLRAGPGGLPPRCSHCGLFSLRVAAASGQIVCFTPGCRDTRGKQPAGRADISRVTGGPVLLWSDGLVQYPPEPEPEPLAGQLDGG